MSKVINLNQVRKQKARDAKRAQGDANAAAFGRTKGEKQRQKQETDSQERHLDGHRRDAPDEGDKP
ncbi:DUF4169 family protein [Mesobacterium pallidum]|uniref:DUF4169 family protein n=1 Tax=Mesobacterium pallidum TaxID=2872037 RepID=UPI001EE30484|nr:DUF4169 family protein [Mesobacterium pallidum]